jgi:hypothetical protein
MKFDELLEVAIVGFDYSSPLKDSDTVRVYHGTSDLDTVILAFTKGLSGAGRANRRYSYEFNNNPRGLFVTPDIKTAKEFGSFVIEFHTRVRDLEAPVWPGGAFTVQGGLSRLFDSEDEREEERLRQRMNWSSSEFEFVKQSDRPELAGYFLTVGERQALFTGDLNPNSIRAVWTSPDPSRIGQTYQRMSPRDFMKMADNAQVPTRFGRAGLDRDSEISRSSDKKVISPRDDISGEEFIDILARKYKGINRDQLIKTTRENPEVVRDRVWNDRQFRQIMSSLG